MSAMFRLKYRSQFSHQLTLPSGSGGRKIYFLDAPSYGNVGDQAIAYAIRMFSVKYFPDYEFVEILQDDLPQYTEFLKKSINAEDMIFLTGGGNMGNVYRIYEATRRFVIKNFPNNKIIVFPQTIAYTENIFGKISLATSQRIYGAHKQLTLMARERFSYEKMQNLYPKNRVILCPDIVLSLQRSEDISARKSIGICLRNDIESALIAQDREYIAASLQQLSIPIETITTITDATHITKENRERIVLDKLDEIAKCRLFVTDRLHGMIFAVLTHTPCIVFENSNGKVRGVYAWVKDSSRVKLIGNIKDLDNAVAEFMHMEHCAAEKDISFSNVVDAIRKG